MKYNLRAIMCRAWEIRRGTRHTFVTALKLAWAEAKGERVYTFNLENARACITALLAPVDAAGVAVLDGKTVGVCKYASRNA